MKWALTAAVIFQLLVYFSFFFFLFFFTDCGEDALYKATPYGLMM
jgi:hypothetical protein